MVYYGTPMCIMHVQYSQYTFIPHKTSKLYTCTMYVLYDND